MKSILTTIVFLALAVSGLAQTRSVIVNTSGVIQSPTNFWSADVTNARSGLGLGTAATNPASAFQPSSATLSNLSSGNGSGLTNVTASSVSSALAISNTTGLQSALDGKLATNGNTTGTASNVTGVVALANGGTGGTNAASAITSLGATTVGANLFTLVNPDGVRFIRINTNNTVSSLTAANFITALFAETNLGTVTSIGMTVPSFLSVSTPTIISNGTFAISLNSQTSRHLLIAPNGGGVPAFRALESDDIPSLAISKTTSLQAALDGKLSTNPTLQISNIAALQTALDGKLTGPFPIAISNVSGLQSALNAKLTTGTVANLASNVTGIVAVANGGTGGSNLATARTGLGATTVGANIFTLFNPDAVTFLRINSDNTATALSDANFRTAIGLGTSATNPASAFQPSSSVLTNLAANNGSSLTNIPVAGVVGALATNGNGAGLTNLTAARITGTVALASNVTGTIAISNGGSGATTAGGARTNFSLGATWLTNTVASNFLAAIGAQSTNGNGFGLTNLNASNITGQIPASNISTLNLSNVSGALIVASGGTGATNSATARTNLGLGYLGTNAVTTLTNLGLANIRSNSINTSSHVSGVGGVGGSINLSGGEDENASGGSIILRGSEQSAAGSINLSGSTNGSGTGAGGAITAIGFGSESGGLLNMNGNTEGPGGSIDTSDDGGSIDTGGTGSIGLGKTDIRTTLTGTATAARAISLPNASGTLALTNTLASWAVTTNAPTARTNLGLGWSALTNSNAGTGLVSVGTNGEVVSPTNFWQVAPIVTRFVESQPTTNQTTNITAARNLHIHSLAISTTGITNTIALPTTNSFNGDVALVVHQGPTSSVTAVRTAGAATNLVTMNQFEQTVEFVFYDNVWQFNHNRSFIEPIYFSGTNAAGHAAESRTNLGLPLAALTNTNNANFQAAVFATNTTPTNAANFNSHAAWMEVTVQTNGSNVSFRIPLYK